MPERQCVRCAKQVEWGCKAYRYPSAETNPDAVPDLDGNWWAWEHPALLPLTFDGEETSACPRHDLRDRPRAWHQMFLYYGLFKAGFLPQAGAVVDQSNRGMEVLRILDSANHECDDALEEMRRRGIEGPSKPVARGPRRNA